MAAIGCALLLSACGSGGGNGNALNTGSTNTATPRLNEIEIQSQFENRITESYVVIDGRRYQIGDKMDISQLPQGLTVQPLEVTVKNIQDGTEVEKYTGEMRIYKQNYSVIAQRYYDKSHSLTNPNAQPRLAEYALTDPFWSSTPLANLPQQGNYTYKGLAIGAKEQGNLEYTVNFDQRTGSGTITGFKESGTISLLPSRIKEIKDDVSTTFSGIEGVATAESKKFSEGDYRLGFAGPAAEEIIGDVIINPDHAQLKPNEQPSYIEIDFAGKR
ncbi:factor H binding family protein [Neisseria montereyensis]|uniref:Factor H binding family protein n=1 Tax=Neisseria montereyensis TaxID=2973938 RepID=A0ABT2FE47_9NEIS|nr:factor H binding family protein [Neisseria montereyensis]MCS4534478.1 factor H binding family protein [Neisseria montereyensis]